MALACGLAGVHLATRWVAPEDLGVYGLFLSLVPLAGMLTHAGLTKHFSRHWLTAPDRPAYLRQWFAASVRQAVWLVLAAAVLGFIQVLQPAAWFGATTLVVAGLAGAAAHAFQLGVQSAGRHWIDFGLTSAHSTTRTFLPLIGLAVTGWGLDALIGGHLLHALVMGVLGLAVVCGLGRRLGGTEHGGGAPATPLPVYTRLFLINGAMALVNQGIVRWTASVTFDDVVLGYVTMAGNLAAVGPSMLAGALWQYHYPRLLETRRTTGANAMRRRADRMLGLYLAGSVVGGLALAALLPYLPGILIAARYVDAVAYVMPLFAFTVGLCGLTLLQGEALVLDEPATAVRATLAGTVVLTGGTVATAALAPAALWTWLSFSPLVALVAARLLLRRRSGSAPAAPLPA